MEKFEFNVELEKQARKSGGDKYVSVGAMPFNVYVPQVISRSKDGYPAQQLKITIEVE